jgi:hypothetical protein
MQHKWHKEIKAWADGAEVQWKAYATEFEWIDVGDGRPMWHRDDVEFRIKPKVKITGRVASNTWLEEHEVRIEALEKIVSPQPKEPQYLYVYRNHLSEHLFRTLEYANKSETYIGKIKLEVEGES